MQVHEHRTVQLAAKSVAETTTALQNDRPVSGINSTIHTHMLPDRISHLTALRSGRSGLSADPQVPDCDLDPRLGIPPRRLALERPYRVGGRSVHAEVPVGRGRGF